MDENPKSEKKLAAFKGKKKKKPTAVASAIEPPPAPGGALPTPRQRSQKWALWIIVAIIFGKLLFEQTHQCHLIEEATYNGLHRVLYDWGVRDKPTVLVIDITKIPVESWTAGGQSGEATSRPKLKEFMQAIADAGAKAIGIDVDFSPEVDPGNPTQLRYIHPDDAEFIDWCLRLADEKKIRIGLGVYRMRIDPNHWLNDRRYMSLAALLGVYNADPRTMINYYANDPDEWPLPSMSAALVGVGRAFGFGRREPLEWLFESYSLEPGGPSTDAGEKGSRVPITATSILDPSCLRRVRQDALEPQVARVFPEMPALVKDRIVLLGDINPTNAEDWFEVKGVGRVPGVMILAAGVETLIAKPLRRFTSFGRLMVDTMLALLIFAAARFWEIGTARWASVATGTWEEIRRHGLLTIVTIVLVVFVSILLITWTRLLWTDFLLVCVFLVLHWLIESIISLYRHR